MGSMKSLMSRCGALDLLLAVELAGQTGVGRQLVSGIGWPTSRSSLGRLDMQDLVALVVVVVMLRSSYCRVLTDSAVVADEHG